MARGAHHESRLGGSIRVLHRGCINCTLFWRRTQRMRILRNSESRLANAVKTYRAALVENNKQSASSLEDWNILLSARQF